MSGAASCPASARSAQKTALRLACATCRRHSIDPDTHGWPKPPRKTRRKADGVRALGLVQAEHARTAGGGARCSVDAARPKSARRRNGGKSVAQDGCDLVGDRHGGEKGSSIDCAPLGKGQK